VGPRPKNFNQSSPGSKNDRPDGLYYRVMIRVCLTLQVLVIIIKLHEYLSFIYRMNKKHNFLGSFVQIYDEIRRLSNQVL